MVASRLVTAIETLEPGPPIAIACDSLLFTYLEFDASLDRRKRALRSWCTARLRRIICGGLDLLPYTGRFETLLDELPLDLREVLDANRKTIGSESIQNAFWRELLRSRKRGETGIGSSTDGRFIRSAFPRRVRLSRRELFLIEHRIGLPQSRGEREQLPYTERFDQLYRALASTFPDLRLCCLTRHEFWVAIVRIMKRVPRGRKHVPAVTQSNLPFQF